jgi:hypothetical protein
LVPGVALLGAVFVVGSAAFWGMNLAVEAPSSTVTLPAPRATSPARGAPVMARKAAAAAMPDKQRVAAPAEVHEALAVGPAREQPRAEPTRDPPDRAAAATDASSGSRYTSLETADCAMFETGNLPVRRCAGAAGYALETGDARNADHFAILGPGSRRSELEFSRIAPGASLGKLAEWRSRGDGEPRALIVRVTRSGGQAVSSLIVARLDSTPCIVAVIPRGTRQNEKARRAADREQLNCLPNQAS